MKEYYSVIPSIIKNPMNLYLSPNDSNFWNDSGLSILFSFDLNFGSHTEKDSGHSKETTEGLESLVNPVKGVYSSWIDLQVRITGPPLSQFGPLRSKQYEMIHRNRIKVGTQWTLLLYKDLLTGDRNPMKSLWSDSTRGNLQYRCKVRSFQDCWSIVAMYLYWHNFKFLPEVTDVNISFLPLLLLYKLRFITQSFVRKKED